MISIIMMIWATFSNGSVLQSIRAEDFNVYIDQGHHYRLLIPASFTFTDMDHNGIMIWSTDDTLKPPVIILEINNLTKSLSLEKNPDTILKTMKNYVKESDISIQNSGIKNVSQYNIPYIAFIETSPDNKTTSYYEVYFFEAQHKLYFLVFVYPTKEDKYIYNQNKVLRSFAHSLYGDMG